MELKKYKKEIGFGLVIIAVICLMAIALLGTAPENDADSPIQESVYIEVPSGDVPKMTESKSEAYLKNGNKAKIEEYWDFCIPDKESPTSAPTSSSSGISEARATSNEDPLGLSSQTHNAPVKRTTSGNPYRETAQEREARHQKRHEEAACRATALIVQIPLDATVKDGRRKSAIPSIQLIALRWLCPCLAMKWQGL